MESVINLASLTNRGSRTLIYGQVLREDSTGSADIVYFHVYVDSRMQCIAAISYSPRDEEARAVEAFDENTIAKTESDAYVSLTRNARILLHSRLAEKVDEAVILHVYRFDIGPRP